MDVIEGGDISNEVAPAALVVFEGLVGSLPTPNIRGRHDFDVKLHRWHTAASRWVINEKTIGTVWLLPYRVELVTYLPVPEADELRLRLEKGSTWPFASMWATTPKELALMLSYHRNLSVVFDADTSRWATYPLGKCKMIPADDPGQMRLI